MLIEIIWIEIIEKNSNKENVICL